MLKHLYKPLVSGLIIVIMAAACAPATPVQDDRVKTLEDKVNSLANLQNQLSAVQGEVDAIQAGQAGLPGLQSKLDGVQSQLDAVSMQVEDLNKQSESEMNMSGGTMATSTSRGAAEDPFALSVAQFVLDTAGFHGMAETISETQKIDPAYLGPVNRAYKVLSQTVWPEPLMEQGDAFVALLHDFSAALEANNVADATTLSDEVHDAQHELSHAIDDWLGEAGNAHTH